jgi:predicted nucleotide-binding protein
VIFEMGMLFGAMGSDKTIILKKGNIEKPSDAEGIKYIEYNVTVDEVHKKIIDRLKNAGVDISDEIIANYK